MDYQTTAPDAPAAAAPAAPHGSVSGATGGSGAEHGALPASASAQAGLGPQSLLTQAPEGEPTAESIRDAAAYDDFTLPDGVETNHQMMDSFRMVAAEHGLSQKAAQSLLDLHSKSMAEHGQAHVAIAQKWAEDARGDREFGGGGFDANMGVARKALQAYGSPQLGQLLAQSGLGNHPEIIRTFYRIGKTLSEDRRVGGGQSTQDDRLAAMYPTMVRR